MAEEDVYIGIDVSKQWLDVAIEPGGEYWRVGNSDPDIGELVKQLVSRGPKCIVVEATGGYEANWLAKTDKC